MLLIHLDAHLFQLPFQPLGGHSVAHKQIHRVLIIYEIAHRIAFRLTPAFGHGLAVILRIFHHGDSLFPQHMHTDPESQPGAHNADGQPQIAGGTHGNRILRVEISEFITIQLGIVILQGEHPFLESQVFGVLEHLIDAPSGLDGAGDGQMAVALEQHPAGDMNTPFLFQSLLHLGNGLHRGFDDPFHFCRLRKGFGDKGGEPLEPGFGLLHISQRQAALFQSLLRSHLPGIDPKGLLEFHQIPHHREFLFPLPGTFAANQLFHGFLLLQGAPWGYCNFHL